MTEKRSRRGLGLPDVPDFSGPLSGMQDQRVTEILRWAQGTRQTWLFDFFERRLAGATTPDPQAELVAAMTEAHLAAAHEALLLTCEAGQILFANNLARDILAERRWLVEHDGRLKGANSASSAALRQALGAIAAPKVKGDNIRLRLDSSDDGPALLLRLAPLRVGHSDTHPRPFVTLHMLRDDADLTLDAQSLIGWYGLSHAEARLAIAFANGAALADYAAEQGVTINTVRTLFARLKTKLGAADQAAVVRKVLLAAARP
jgi:epsilon-lactone hydrolase